MKSFSLAQLTHRLALACSLLLVLPSCSMAASSTTTFSVQTDPQDAQIFINNQLVGVGMASLKVNNKDDVSVVVTREGYIGFQRTFESSLSTAGWLDIISIPFTLVSGAGLASGGAWEFEQDSLYVRLVPESSSEQQ